MNRKGFKRPAGTLAPPAANPAMDCRATIRMFLRDTSTGLRAKVSAGIWIISKRAGCRPWPGKRIVAGWRKRRPWPSR